MAARLTVLASGSAGNASLLEADGFGLLIDAGLGPRKLASRLSSIGAAWTSVHALILTHTHGDHWNRSTLAWLHRQRIAVYCHADHVTALQAHCPAFPAMQAARLVRTYEPGVELPLSATLRCRPLTLRHDSGATFGFRFDGAATLLERAWSLGYAADLGCWDQTLAEALAGVDVLALEFNHDVQMQRSSGRSEALVARVLGDDGHLSNEQAAAFLAEVVRRTDGNRLRHVVQLHLSRQCNLPALAAQAAQQTLSELGCQAQVHTACQEQASARFALSQA